jgi:hypothetical protein
MYGRSPKQSAKERRGKSKTFHTSGGTAASAEGAVYNQFHRFPPSGGTAARLRAKRRKAVKSKASRNSSVISSPVRWLREKQREVGQPKLIGDLLAGRVPV